MAINPLFIRYGIAGALIAVGVAISYLKTRPKKADKPDPERGGTIVNVHAAPGVAAKAEKDDKAEKKAAEEKAAAEQKQAEENAAKKAAEEKAAKEKKGE